MMSQGGLNFTLSTAAVTAATSPLKNTVACPPHFVCQVRKDTSDALSIWSITRNALLLPRTSTNPKAPYFIIVSSLLFINGHLQRDLRVFGRRRDNSVVDDLHQRFGCLKSRFHSRLHIRNSSSHLDAGAAFQSVTLHTLDLHIGCLGSCVQRNKAGYQVIQFKNAYGHSIIILCHNTSPDFDCENL